MVSKNEIIAKHAESIGKDLTYRLDQLYAYGKEKGWSKEIMHYLMWWEHETIRLVWRANEVAKGVRELPVSE